MSSKLKIHLLGDFHISYNAKTIESISTSRLQTILAYLLLHHDVPQPRTRLAFLFWPNSRKSSARNNLRQLIYQLRQALPEPDRFLRIDGATIAWKLDSDQTVDLVEFERSIEKASTAEKQQNHDLQRYTLEQFAQVYQGDLLPGCYDEWIMPEHEQIHAVAVASYQKLIDLHEQQRDYSAAIQTGKTLLRLDPLNENTYLLLMRLYLHHKNQVGAIQTYHNACEVLEKEFGLQPGPALEEAYQRIRQAETSDFERNVKALQGVHLLVGRQLEWRQMMNIWQHVYKGSAGMVILSGEAGIGKTRLAEEMMLWANQQGILTASARAYHIEGQLSLAPVKQWLLDTHFQTAFKSMEPVRLIEISRLIPELRTRYPHLQAPEPISEYGQRQHFFKSLVMVILFHKRPTLLLLDDLQWCDQETIEWLHFLLQFDRQAPLLILATVRIELVPSELARLTQQLGASGQLTTLALPPLDASETAKLAGQTLGKELDLPAALQLYRETEGNPLFIIEMIHTGFEDFISEDGTDLVEGGMHITLPPRVQAVIIQRLAQLSDHARHVAEIGAVYGKPFTLNMLLNIDHNDEDKLVSALDELWQKRIIQEQVANTYSFTHDKLREVTYAELSPPQRRLLHRRIAQAFEALNDMNTEPVNGHIAAHYDQAGVPEKAIPFYQLAGTTAARVYANDDAIALLKRGLELLDQLPVGKERDLQELTLQFSIASLYRLTKGWTAPELGQALNRALDLCDQVGTSAQRAHILYGLQSMYAVEGRLDEVCSTYDEMYQLFLQIQGSLPEFAALMHTGAILHMGNLEKARQAFDAMIASHDAEQIKDLQASHGVNYLAHGYAWNAHALFLGGCPESALRSAQKGVQIAQYYEQPFNQALTVTYLATLQEFRADASAFILQAEQALVLAEESEAPYYQNWAQILVRFANATNNPSEVHIKRLEEAIHIFVMSGVRLRLPYYLSLLARTYQKAGRPEQALIVIEQSIAEARKNNERCWDAELHRLRGELLLLQALDGAEVELLHAMEIARKQRALTFELRAAISIAHLWFSQKRIIEGKQLLSPILARFNEGQEMPDNQYARSLLTLPE